MLMMHWFVTCVLGWRNRPQNSLFL